MKQWLEPDEIRSLHGEEKNDSLQLLDRIKTIYYNIIVTLLIVVYAKNLIRSRGSVRSVSCFFLSVLFFFFLFC